MSHPRTRSAGLTRRFLLALCGLVALTSLVAGCSDDDGGSGDDNGPEVTLDETGADATGPDGSTTTPAPVEAGTAAEYEAALLDSLTGDPDNASLMDADQASCVAPAWVEAITPERFGAAGLTPDDVAAQTSMSAIARTGLDLDQAEGLLSLMVDCGVDLRGRALAQTTATDGSELDEAARACLSDGLTTELVQRYAAVSLTGDATDPAAAEVAGAYLAVLQGCGVYPGG